MSGGSNEHINVNAGMAIMNILIVGLFALVGGLLIKLLGGMKCPKSPCCKKGCELKPILTKITIPPLVGMIIFGCLARNILPTSFTDDYNDVWAGYIRMVCLGVILLRGGLELEFKGKGITVVLLTLTP